MIAEAVEQVAAWLADGVTGFNAIRASVPLSVGWAVPPAVTVKTEITDAWVAREKIDRDAVTGPMLLISGEIGPTFGFHPALTREPKTNAGVAIRYAARGANSAAIVLQTRLSIRIAQRSIAFNVGSLLSSWTRNQVVFDVPSGEPFALAVSAEDDLVVGGFTVNFPASDPWALGIG